MLRLPAVPAYLEHPSRVARWRNGAFEVLPEASTATQTVWFIVDRQDPGDVLWEGLLTQPAGSDQAIVVAIPAFVDDVTLGDRVGVTRHEGALVATRRLRDAGRFPFRVLFPERENTGNDTRWRDLMMELEPYGCWFDVYSYTLVALSADGEATPAVVDLLEDARRKGRLQYEAGRTVPPVRAQPQG